MSFGHPNTRFMPNPRDRSVNDPAVLVESKHIRAYIDYRRQFTGVSTDADVVLETYVNEARREGWNDVKILGASVLLTADAQKTEG